MTTDLAWLVLRAAGLVLPLQAAGGMLFMAAFARRLAHAAPPIRRTAVQAALLALAVLAAQYCIEPAHLAGEWSGLADASLWRLARGSSAAVALALRLAGLAALYTGLRGERTASQLAGLAGCMAVLGSFALTGHTVLAVHRSLTAALLLMHVAIVAFWFGALLPLRQLCAREARECAAAVIGRFSALALWLVPLIPLAGAGIAALLLPDLAALLAPYGLLLIGKLMLFAALLALAALNKLRWVPALAAGVPGALRGFQRAVAAEYILICIVLGVTTVLTGLASPPHL